MGYRRILILVSCGIIAAVWFAVRSVREEEKQWITLKGGAQMRILTVATGGSQQIEVPGPPFVERARMAWKQRSLQPLQSGGGSKLTVSSGGNTKIAIWAVIRGIPPAALNNFNLRINKIRDFEIPLSDGQILLGQGGGSSSSGNNVVVCYLARFDLAPKRERELTLTFTFEGERYALKFANPIYQAQLPSWAPEPLPKTFREGELAVTLEALDLKWNDRYYYYGARWALKPKWAVTFNGQRADSWFHVGSLFSDSYGNVSSYTGMLGEPALKLNVQVSRSPSYPFAANEVRWLARFDPAELRKLPNGKHQIYKASGDVLGRGILFAGVLTPGLYELEDGAVVASSPPAPDQPIKSFKAALDPNTRRLKLEVHQVSFVQHTERHIGDSEDEFRVVQYDNGKGVYLANYGTSGTGSESVTWAGLPDRPFRYGLAKQQRFSFEMFVKPPKAPARKEESDKL